MAPSGSLSGVTVTSSHPAGLAAVGAGIVPGTEGLAATSLGLTL